MDDFSTAEAVSISLQRTRLETAHHHSYRSQQDCFNLFAENAPRDLLGYNLPASYPSFNLFAENAPRDLFRSDHWYRLFHVSISLQRTRLETRMGSRNGSFDVVSISLQRTRLETDLQGKTVPTVPMGFNLFAENAPRDGSLFWRVYSLVVKVLCAGASHFFIF